MHYFGTVKDNSVTLNAFAEIMKVINQTGLQDAKLAWYSPSSIHQLCISGMEHGFGIHDFRSTCLYLIVEVLLTEQNFFNHLLTVL